MNTTTTKKDQRQPLKVPDSERLVWTGPELAARLGVTRWTITAMDRAGLIPKPMRYGPSAGVVAWRRDEIIDWVRAGMPERRRWRWEPAALPRVSELLEGRRKQLAVIEHDIQDAAQQLADLRTTIDRERAALADIQRWAAQAAR